MSNPAPTPIPWRDRASCRDVDPETFFPEGDPALLAAASTVCGSCPVRRQCLSDGIREPYGVRAGLSEDERDPIARAYGLYRQLVASAHNALAQVAAGDEGLREALAALETEADTVSALALTVAAGGATEAELRELAAFALDARHATVEALAGLYLAPQPGMDRAVTRLMAAAVQTAAVHATPTVSSPAVDLRQAGMPGGGKGMTTAASTSAVPSIVAVA